MASDLSLHCFANLGDYSCWQFEVFFCCFCEKIRLGWQFTWNTKSYFLRKIMIKKSSYKFNQHFKDGVECCNFTKKKKKKKLYQRKVVINKKKAVSKEKVSTRHIWKAKAQIIWSVWLGPLVSADKVIRYCRINQQTGLMRLGRLAGWSESAYFGYSWRTFSLDAVQNLKPNHTILTWHMTSVKMQARLYINPRYWDREVWANSVDPDQMPHSVASDQGLHCLPLVQQYF